MLRSFRLSNHRSIADEQELLLMPARHSEQPVVPVTAIYGANASGKSNVISGLEFMRSAVLDSFSKWEIEGVPRKPFRLNAAGRAQPSVYVAELVVDGVSYTYGFSVDDREVLEEWLYSYPEKRRRTLFSRERGEIRFGSTLGDLKPKLEMLEELTRSNSLFLSAAARLNLEALTPVYRWFETGLRIRRSGRRSTIYVAEAINNFLAKNPENRSRLVSLLTAADVGITGIRVKHVHDQFRSGPTVELRFEHGVKGEEFELDDESDGTRSWLELLPVVLDALDEGAVVAVDEIDTSLHPLLTAQLIGLFQDPATNSKNAQLIVTTHDTSLLGTMIADKVLDRDQIWFVQKNSTGATELYPLTDFKPRQDQNLERRYLGGSYGAIPVLDHEDFVNAVRKR